MKWLFYLFLLVSIVFSNKFNGYIIDEDSGNPISNVYLLNQDNIIAISNIDGYFIFENNNLSIEMDSILFKHIAYKNKKIELSKLPKKIYLKKDILHGDAIEITSSRKETRLSESPMITYVISEKDLASNLTTLLKAINIKLN